MNNNKYWFFGYLFISLLATFLLVTGSPLLTLAVDQNNMVPLGTFITWAGMISLPATIYYGIDGLRNPKNIFFRFLSELLKTTISLGVLWVPLSYLLSGNISFSFNQSESFQGSQEAMKWFWWLSYSIPIGSILTLIIYGVSLLLIKIKNRRKTE